MRKRRSNPIEGPWGAVISHWLCAVSFALSLVGCGPSGTAGRKESSAPQVPAPATRSSLNARPGDLTPESCVKDLEARDVKQAVKRDVARGERRFFRVWAEEHTYLGAPGIAGCPLVDVKLARIEPINRFDDSNYLVKEPERLCKFAIDNFKMRYNQELAKLLGPFLEPNCHDAPGKIDRFSKPFDFHAYRERMATIRSN